MEAHHRNGGNPFAELVAFSMTNQQHLNRPNAGKPSLLGAPRIKQTDLWLERPGGLLNRNPGNRSKDLGYSKFWGVSEYRGRGCYVSFYEENGREYRKWAHPKTVFIGTYTEEVDAAKAHDLATIAISGTAFRLNFPVSQYQEDLKRMRSMNLTDRLKYIRRNPKCISRGNETGFRGISMAPQYNNGWLAKLGTGAAAQIYIGTFDTELDAARAYDVAAILLQGPESHTNFQKENYNEIGTLEILRSKRGSFNEKVINVLERKWAERFGYQEKTSSGTYSESLQQRGQIGSSSNITAPAGDPNISNVIVQTNIGTVPTKVAPYDFSSLMTKNKNAVDGKSRNAMSMPSPLVQTVASPVSNLSAAIENAGIAELPRYHNLNQLQHKSKEHQRLFSFPQLQNATYFGGHQNLNSLQGYQFPKIYVDASGGPNEELGYNVGLRETIRSGHDWGNGTPPLSFPLHESPSTMEKSHSHNDIMKLLSGEFQSCEPTDLLSMNYQTSDTRPLLLGAMFKIGSTSKHLGIYHQRQAFSPRRFPSYAEEPLHNAKPMMPYQFDNQFDTNTSELVGDSFLQDACEPVVEVDANGTYDLGNLAEPEPSELLSNNVFQKTSGIMNVDEILVTMEADKCFDGTASFGNSIETNEGSNHKNSAAASTEGNEYFNEYSTLMEDLEFSKWWWSE